MRWGSLIIYVLAVLFIAWLVLMVASMFLPPPILLAITVPLSGWASWR